MKVYNINLSTAKSNLKTIKENSFKNNRRNGIILVESLHEMNQFQEHAMDDLNKENPEWSSEEILDKSSTVIGIITSIKEQSKSSEDISGSYGVKVGIQIMECIEIINDIQMLIE